MSNEINYENNPLNGVGLKQLTTELVDHYGFDILFAYLNINCFKTNPSIDASVKFLKKTTWAREKVEVFYMYQYKNLPRASSTQFKLPPRDRVVPDGQVAREPAELSLEDAERLREKQLAKAAEFQNNKRGGGRQHKPSHKSHTSNNKRRFDEAKREDNKPSKSSADDPWADWRG